MESKRPKVSIIMGAYNCAHIIRKAVNSILSQDYRDWELIICNDGSKDMTVNILHELEVEDERIKVISNDRNRGLAYSLNHCLQEVNGEYVARMDADDIILPDRLALQVQFLDSHKDYDVVGGGIILYDESGERQTILNPEYPDVKIMRLRVPFFHPTIMMRKSAYDKLGGYLDLPRTRRGQDLDLWFRFFAAGMKGYNLQQPVIKYHDDQKDQLKKNSIKLSWNLTKTRVKGFKINHFPFYYYPFAFAHLAIAAMPNWLSFKIHKLLN